MLQAEVPSKSTSALLRHKILMLLLKEKRISEEWIPKLLRL